MAGDDGGKNNLMDRRGRKFSVDNHEKNDTSIKDHVSNITLKSHLPSSQLLSSPDAAMRLLALDRSGDHAVLSIQKEAADAEAFIANQELESARVELQRAVMDSQKKDRQLTMFKRYLKGAEDQICNLKLKIDLAEAEKKMLKDYFTEEKENMMEQTHFDYKHYKYAQASIINAPDIQAPKPDDVQRTDKVALTKTERKRKKLWKKVKGQASYIRRDDATLKLEKLHSRNREVKVVDGAQCDDRQFFLPSTRGTSNRSCSSSCSRFFPHSSGKGTVTTTSSNTAKSTQKIVFIRRSSRCKEIQYQTVQDGSEDCNHINLVEINKSNPCE